jgi:hypothetical protein
VQSQLRAVAFRKSCRRYQRNSAKLAAHSGLRFRINFGECAHVVCSKRTSWERNSSNIVTRTGSEHFILLRLSIPVQGKNHVDGGIHFDRFAIEQRWLIAPLTNSSMSSIKKEWMTGQHFDFSNRPSLSRMTCNRTVP